MIDREAQLIARYREGNTFARRAARARMASDRLNGVSAEDAAMAHSFPLGGGVARRGAASRIDQSVSRAVKAVYAERHARTLEAQAEAFDAGRINRQGYPIRQRSAIRRMA